MRETKVQKIARLEKKIEEQKKEMTEIKKDRKRLNYAVERLERQIQKLSAQSSKEDAAKIKELENKLEKAREYCKDLVAKHNKSVAVFREIARRNKILRNSPEISDKDFNMKRLSYCKHPVLRVFVGLKIGATFAGKKSICSAKRKYWRSSPIATPTECSEKYGFGNSG